MTRVDDGRHGALGTFRLGAQADDLYETLVRAHDGLDEQASAELNARLVLILMNAVGDSETIRGAIAAARADPPPQPPADDGT